MPCATANYAFDKQSARSFDADGRMRVRGCVISVGEINPYYGREIPGYQALGLDANKVYDLYRDPDELSMAADSFNGLPLMIRHIAQTADEPRKEHQGGSVFNVRFEAPRLLADLLVSDGKAIEFVQSGMLADLSSSYRYKPDMTPGEINGHKFDGRMVAIEGNHVALVEDGRATGAHVADSALNPQPGANNVDPNVTPQPETGGNAEIAQALMLLTQKLEGIESRLDKIDGTGAPDPVTDPPAAVVEDEDPEAPKKAEEAERAMDAKITAAVSAAVTATNKARDDLDNAKRAVRPVLGDTIAMDSASAVYRAALLQVGIPDKDIAAGTEHIAWQAYQTGTGGASPTRANDARSTEVKRHVFDTSHIRTRG
jgi:hypothetical protein